jgi:hypothetical protein
MRDHRRRHPAQLFCALMGPVLLVVGIGGFIASAAFDTGHPDGSDLLIFEVNGWHNLVHIASGLLLLAGVRSYAAARTVTLTFAMAYGLVTIIGWIDGHDVLGLFPVDTADNLLHTFLTLAALAFGLMSAPDGELRHKLLRGQREGREGVRTEASRVSPTSPSALAREDRFRREGSRDPSRSSAPTEGSR